MKDSTGRHKYKDAHLPEYETIGLFGSNCKNDNLQSIVKANDICNDNGMDTISAGEIVSFAIECYENGIITKENTDGLELKWGDDLAIIELLEKISMREGIGDLLADGVKLASERLGQGSEKFAMHIGGQELPSHDPKAEYGFASCYIVDATPGRHMRWHAPFIPPGIDVPEHDPHGFSGRGPAQKIGMNCCHTMEGLGLCGFVLGCYPHVDPLLAFIHALTGWDFTVAEYLQVGERLANIRQSFNIREGINMLEYKIPDRFVGRPPLTNGPLEGKTLDTDAIRREDLEVMDWGLEFPLPSRAKLEELSLDNVIADLYPGN
jgi:aldehyde:ferredoxin oxidoreductase